MTTPLSPFSHESNHGREFNENGGVVRKSIRDFPEQNLEEARERTMKFLMESVETETDRHRRIMIENMKRLRAIDLEKKHLEGKYAALNKMKLAKQEAYLKNLKQTSKEILEARQKSKSPPKAKKKSDNKGIDPLDTKAVRRLIEADTKERDINYYKLNSSAIVSSKLSKKASHKHHNESMPISILSKSVEKEEINPLDSVMKEVRRIAENIEKISNSRRESPEKSHIYTEGARTRTEESPQPKKTTESSDLSKEIHDIIRKKYPKKKLQKIEIYFQDTSGKQSPINERPDVRVSASDIPGLDQISSITPKSKLSQATLKSHQEVKDLIHPLEQSEIKNSKKFNTEEQQSQKDKSKKMLIDHQQQTEQQHHQQHYLQPPENKKHSHIKTHNIDEIVKQTIEPIKILQELEDEDEPKFARQHFNKRDSTKETKAETVATNADMKNNAVNPYLAPQSVEKISNSTVQTQSSASKHNSIENDKKYTKSTYTTIFPNFETTTKSLEENHNAPDNFTLNPASGPIESIDPRAKNLDIENFKYQPNSNNVLSPIREVYYEGSVNLSKEASLIDPAEMGIQNTGNDMSVYKRKVGPSKTTRYNQNISSDRDMISEEPLQNVYGEPPSPLKKYFPPKPKSHNLDISQDMSSNEHKPNNQAYIGKPKLAPLKDSKELLKANKYNPLSNLVKNTDQFPDPYYRNGKVKGEHFNPLNRSQDQESNSFVGFPSPAEVSQYFEKKFMTPQRVREKKPFFTNETQIQTEVYPKKLPPLKSDKEKPVIVKTASPVKRRPKYETESSSKNQANQSQSQTLNDTPSIDSNSIFSSFKDKFATPQQSQAMIVELEPTPMMASTTHNMLDSQLSGKSSPRNYYPFSRLANQHQAGLVKPPGPNVNIPEYPRRISIKHADSLFSPDPKLDNFTAPSSNYDESDTSSAKLDFKKNILKRVNLLQENELKSGQGKIIAPQKHGISGVRSFMEAIND